MFTIVAFSESIDEAAALVNIAGVPDQHVKVIGDGIYITEFNRLLGAMVFAGSTGVEARLISPSLRRINPHYIAPINIELYPAGEPLHTVDPKNGIALDPNEALEAQINADPAGAEQHTIIIWLSTAPIVPVEGEIFTVKAEITIALLAGEWSFGEIDFVDELPIGDYDVVGFVPVVDTAVAARFVPVGMAYRPGAPCLDAIESNQPSPFRFGSLGTWFTFNTVQPPGLEILSSAAAGSTKYSLYIDLKKRA